MSRTRIKYLYRVVDQRAGDHDLPLMAVSIHHGVVQRDALTDDLPRAEDLSNYKICRSGDIVLNRMRAFQGAIGISSQDGLVSPDYLVLRPNPDTSPQYLYYLFRSTWFVGEMTSRLRGIGNTENGSVRTPRINSEDLGDIIVDFPDLDDQRRIADFLDIETTRMGRLLSYRHEQMRIVAERFEAIWSAHVKNDGITSGWLPLRRLITAITDGPFGSSLASDHYTDSGARVIRLGNIGQARFRNEDAAYIAESHYHELRRHRVLEGDLIVAGLGDENYPLGRACVAPSGLGHAIVKADCFRLRLDPNRITHEYAAWALSSPPVARKILEMSRGSTRQRINLSIAREIAIPVPPLSDQNELVSSLASHRESVDGLSAACNRQCALLTERRQALITAAITGQIDVTRARRSDLVGGAVT